MHNIHKNFPSTVNQATRPVTFENRQKHTSISSQRRGTVDLTPKPWSSPLLVHKSVDLTSSPLTQKQVEHLKLGKMMSTGILRPEPVKATPFNHHNGLFAQPNSATNLDLIKSSSMGSPQLQTSNPNATQDPHAYIYQLGLQEFIKNSQNHIKALEQISQRQGDLQNCQTPFTTPSSHQQVPLYQTPLSQLGRNYSSSGRLYDSSGAPRLTQDTSNRDSDANSHISWTTQPRQPQQTRLHELQKLLGSSMGSNSDCGHRRPQPLHPTKTSYVQAQAQAQAEAQAQGASSIHELQNLVDSFIALQNKPANNQRNQVPNLSLSSKNSEAFQAAQPVEPPLGDDDGTPNFVRRLSFPGIEKFFDSTVERKPQDKPGYRRQMIAQNSSFSFTDVNVSKQVKEVAPSSMGSGYNSSESSKNTQLASLKPSQILLKCPSGPELQRCTVPELVPEYSDGEDFEMVERNEVSHEKIRAEIPLTVHQVEVYNGHTMSQENFTRIFRRQPCQQEDDSRLPIIPKTRSFRIFKYRNPQTRRNLKILKCDHAGCSKFFRKFHNFYDHLRIHTGERPHECPFAAQTGCTLKFTQKSNLNKHVRTHYLDQVQLKCSFCPKIFKNDHYLKRHLKDSHKISQKCKAIRASCQGGSPDAQALPYPITLPLTQGESIVATPKILISPTCGSTAKTQQSSSSRADLLIPIQVGEQEELLIDGDELLSCSDESSLLSSRTGPLSYSKDDTRAH